VLSRLAAAEVTGSSYPFEEFGKVAASGATRTHTASLMYPQRTDKGESDRANETAKREARNCQSISLRSGHLGSPLIYDRSAEVPHLVEQHVKN
jgi:hypothetical protein